MAKNALIWKVELFGKIKKKTICHSHLGDLEKSLDEFANNLQGTDKKTQKDQETKNKNDVTGNE